MSKPLALLTGGSTGIGHHLVTALAEAGYAVAFSYRASPAPAEALAQDLVARGHAARALACDVGDKVQVEAFVGAAIAWAGQPPSLLVNNAGIQAWAPLLDLAEEQWDDVLRTNLKGCFLHTQVVGRIMAEAGQGGAIVNIGSGCNKLAFPNLVSYTASKGGIEQFTKSAAVELGRYGITVNCVAPGAIATERTAEEAPDYAASWAPITPLGRVGTPEDIAGPVLFFAGPGARYVTGQTLWVDGGVFSRAAWPYS
ncbi:MULTISPECIES: SDR family NAD(P)-dependent oxidoreductase [unclassified Novosphingobium]|uniref:SDR family oxidoreductase n=1 Tax=unclassified Novosphingobium TaxID=2644732 RepID=UPI001840570F|nr:NAD(P)-dependent dehydrogenase (short-subunit alcohol dehydrogenase family) [Novosphingobium sp. SG919]NMN85327.1 NAD(P)-dependent dehydrogenase (short-subunit alcohol dehydrogenase family) [Novosphingobium sp. SG916]